MLSGTIAFVGGTLLLYQLTTLPQFSHLVLIWLLPLLLYRTQFTRRLALWALLFTFGFTLSAVDAYQRLEPRLAPELEGELLRVDGVVDSLPRHEGRILRFEFAVRGASLLEGQKVELPERLRLSWYNDGPDTLAPGQRWQLRVKLKRPHGMSNPGGFDYEGWLFQQGIGATGYVRSRGDNRLLQPAGWSHWLMRLRHHINGEIGEALAGQPMRGVITALSIGERGAISDEQWQVLLASGTNHLVAISGLHVGLVAGLVFFLVRWLWRRCARCCTWLAAPRAGAMAAIVAGLFYAALAGFSLPTQRALVMLAIVLGALWLQRPLQRSRVLLLAMWAVVLLDPASLLSAGFWLSFAAVAAILYGMGSRLENRSLWWRWGRVQLLASLALLPLLLLFFQQGSLSAPLANLVAVPWVSLLVVPLTLLGVVALLIWPPLGIWLLGLAAVLLEWLWPLLEWINSLIPVLPRAITPWALLPALVGMVWLFAPHGWPARWAGVILLLPMLLWQAERPAEGEARFTLLDVGQGMAAVVETQSAIVVFDTGPRYPSGFDTGDAVVVPFLRKRGIGRIDTLIVSHSGNDHAGGVSSVVKQMTVGRILTGLQHRTGWPETFPCTAGMRWQRDGVTFRMLHPAQAGLSPEENNHSCVLHVATRRGSVLLTADIESSAEAELVARGESLSADILVAPHHGSKTSSSSAFIDAVSPNAVLFSVGYRNRYGFPHEAVVERYLRRGIEQYRTDRSGALQFDLGSGELEPTAQREIARRIWTSP